MSNLLSIEDLYDLLQDGVIKVNEPLKKYTFTQTGGNADILILPKSYGEVREIVKYCHSNSIPLTILGNGSNLVIKDGGIRGITLVLTNLNRISTKDNLGTGTSYDNKIIAQSGAAIIDTSRFASENHLTGLEFACGIPGTVGGAVYMNAGAYGGEISDVIESVLVLTEEGEFVTLYKEDLALEYRKSILSKKNYLVLEATFTLSEGSIEEIKGKMDDFTEKRTSKQPLEHPSCGSVFKRPPGHFAGKLIQDAGLQGYRIGGVEVSTKHAGFMVNVDNGTATDYIQLIQHVQHVVYQRFGVELETEVKIIGEDV